MKTKLLRKIRKRYLFKIVIDDKLPKYSKYWKQVVYMDKNTGKANYCCEVNFDYSGHYTPFQRFIYEIGYESFLFKNIKNKHKRYEISLGKKLFKCK